MAIQVIVLAELRKNRHVAYLQDNANSCFEGATEEEALGHLLKQNHEAFNVRIERASVMSPAEARAARAARRERNTFRW